MTDQQATHAERAALAAQLRATNAPPAYLDQAPRSPGHGRMCLMLRNLHRFPPMRETAKAPPDMRTRLDDRILASMGAPPATLTDAATAGFWERFDAIQTAYIRSANI